MMEIDRQWLVVEQLHAPINSERLWLRPGGYLVGVSAEVKSFEGWKPKPNDRADLEGVIRIEITDTDDNGLYGRFIIPISHGFHKGGVLLPEPLPNLNAAQPFVLRFLDPPPPLIVSTVSCWVNTAESMAWRDDESVWS